MSEFELNPCPFCGGKPELKHIGNEYTKKRVIEINCTKCHAKRTDASIRFGMDWLENAAKEAWNKRVDSWIKVEDRLPEDGQEVIFIAGETAISRCLIMQYQGRKLGGWYYKGSFCVPGRAFLASYWMPMPEGPEEKT